MNVTATVPAKSVSLSAVVTRCGCSDAQKRHPDWHGKHGAACPRPRRTENPGRIAYWHRNVLRRSLWRIGQYLRGRTPGTARFTKE